MSKVHLTHAQVENAVRDLVERVKVGFSQYALSVYPIPRGGVPIAYLFKALADKGITYNVEIVDAPEEADIIIDDICDTGATAKRYSEHAPVYAAFMKGDHDGWLVFPWEVVDDHPEMGEDTVTRMLQLIGEDATRGGLLETPNRVIKAWDTWFGGYEKDPAAVLKAFEDGAQGVDEMVLETDIPVYSHCEHHMAPIFGVAHIGYIPNGRVLGLSKLVRVVDIFARRLQVQERLTNQVADALVKNLDALGVGVILQCRHMCMESRGVKSSGVITTTSALRGALKTEHDARAEFLNLVGMAKSGKAI